MNELKQLRASIRNILNQMNQHQGDNVLKILDGNSNFKENSLRMHIMQGAVFAYQAVIDDIDQMLELNKQPVGVT